MIWAYTFTSVVVLLFSYRVELAARLRMGAGYARLMARMARRRVVAAFAAPDPPPPPPSVAEPRPPAKEDEDESDGLSEDEGLPPE